MQQQQVKDLAQRFIAALNALEQGDEDDVEGIVALFSPEARLTNAALKLAGEERRGRDGVRAFWTEYRRTFRTARSEFQHITVDEYAAGLFWTTRGEDATGQPLEYDGVSLLVFDDDGAISAFRGYYDTRQVSRTVGV